MNDADFALIKARLPKLRWRRWSGAATTGSRRREWAARVYRDGGLWRWELMRQVGPDSYQTAAEGSVPCRLGRCLRSLECAIRREANALAGMIGEGVAK